MHGNPPNKPTANRDAIMHLISNLALGDTELKPDTVIRSCTSTPVRTLAVEKQINGQLPWKKIGNYNLMNMYRKKGEDL